MSSTLRTREPLTALFLNNNYGVESIVAATSVTSLGARQSVLRDSQSHDLLIAKPTEGSSFSKQTLCLALHLGVGAVNWQSE